MTWNRIDDFEYDLKLSYLERKNMDEEKDCKWKSIGNCLWDFLEELKKNIKKTKRTGRTTKTKGVN
jgi:hypothetical protein